MIFYDSALERYIAYREYFFIKAEAFETFWGATTRRLYKVKGYNCYGKLIQDTTVATWDEETLPTNTFVDARSLHAMQLGCCPPVFEGEIEGYGEIGKEGVDAVEEAAKLHKRGYLGGAYQVI